MTFERDCDLALDVGLAIGLGASLLCLLARLAGKSSNESGLVIHGIDARDEVASAACALCAAVNRRMCQ